ncbi:MAG: fused DSP-PTPase phosphatase/NAD kinase-like protein [Vicinamibacterales bacterium]
MLIATLLLVTLVQQAPEKSSLPGARNVTRVDAVVMCGGATTNDAFPTLKKHGFVSVINLRQADEAGVDIDGSRAAAEAAGLRYVHVPVRSPAPDPASVEAFLRAVQDRSNQPMYIHCGSANRVGAMWLIKRVVVDGWEIPRATDEANAIGLTSAALRQFAVDYATAHRRR